MQATCGRASAPHSTYHPHSQALPLPPPSPPNHPIPTPPPPRPNPTPNPPPPPAPRPALPALPSVPRAGMTSARQGLRRHCGSSCSLCRSSRLRCERCATRCYWRARSHSLIYEDATGGGQRGSCCPSIDKAHLPLRPAVIKSQDAQDQCSHRVRLLEFREGCPQVSPFPLLLCSSCVVSEKAPSAIIRAQPCVAAHAC